MQTDAAPLDQWHQSQRPAVPLPPLAADRRDDAAAAAALAACRAMLPKQTPRPVPAYDPARDLKPYRQ